MKKNSQYEYALANVQTYDDTHQRISRQSAFPLGRVQSKTRADAGAKFKICPIRATYTALQRLQMVAGHLNVPTLWMIPLKNIDSRGEILYKIAPPLRFQ